MITACVAGCFRGILWQARGTVRTRVDGTGAQPMARITEIAPDIFQITTYVAPFDLQFHQFLLRDDDAVLFHTGMPSLFPDVRDAVFSLIEPERLRWIGFSHFESDECGALRQWQEAAPQATAVCSEVAKATGVDDVVAARPAEALPDNARIETGRHTLRFLQTPHVPHDWGASLLHDETTGTLFCSDLLTHKGDVEPLTDSDALLGRFEDSMRGDQGTAWAHAYPCSKQTLSVYERLADLQPSTLAIMHGSSYTGDGQKMLRAYRDSLRALANDD